MEILQNITNFWIDFLLVGASIWFLALINVAIVTILVHKKKTILGAIVALIAGALGQISKIVFLSGIILAMVKMVLNFI